MYQHYVRRTQGKEAARKVFSSTKEIRKKGTLSYQVRRGDEKLIARAVRCEADIQPTRSRRRARSQVLVGVL